MAIDPVHTPTTVVTGAPVDPAWSVHLGTAACTCFRFVYEPLRDSDPWPLTRVISDLRARGARPVNRPRALGSGRGIPLIHAQEMMWSGCHLELEAHHLRDHGADEISLMLPAWDELLATVEREDDLWDTVDTVAAASAPRFGIVGDGESIIALHCDSATDVRRLLHRHVGVMLHDDAEAGSKAASRYRELPRSGMIVLLR
ncbi:MAG: hypothetical protein ACYDCS_14140 [Candidatus Dormibacteria bacterium]